MTSSVGSISRWIPGLVAGTPAATQEIARRFFKRVVGLARTKLEAWGTPRRAADEEDVANGVLRSFLEAAQQGRFQHLSQHDQLWRIIAKMTVMKAIDLHRHETAARRGGDDLILGEWISQVDDAQQETEIAAAQSLERLLDSLPADQRSIAERYLMGHTYAEIAQHLGITEHMVRRRVERIVATARKIL